MSEGLISFQNEDNSSTNTVPMGLAQLVFGVAWRIFMASCSEFGHSSNNFNAIRIWHRSVMDGGGESRTRWHTSNYFCECSANTLSRV